ncbi:MAG: sulfatase [Bacteroidota bacterium]
MKHYFSLFLICLVACRATTPEEKAKPNILIIIADDLNEYGMLHTYAPVQVPNMDAFRETAITFPYTYCAAPECNPSRAALLSGMAPHRTGSYHNGGKPWARILQDVISLPEHMKANAYSTFGRGKLFHSEMVEGKEAKCWDNQVYKGGFGPFPPEEAWGPSKFFSFKAWEGPDQDFPDVKNVEATVDFLQEDHEKPFFAVLGLWRPHTPFTAPKRFFDQYQLSQFDSLPPGYWVDDSLDVAQESYAINDMWDRFPLIGPSNPQLWRQYLHAYAASTSFADWSFGKVIEALDASQYADNTLVLFFSDNGYHCGEKNNWEKSTLWERAANTPMMVRLPDKRNQGQECYSPVSLLDLYPSLIEFADLSPAPHSLDGESIVPLWEDVSQERSEPVLTSFGERWASIRDARYRYISYPDGGQELYDHQSDPFEFHNLAQDSASLPTIERLQSSLPADWATALQSDKWDRIRANREKLSQ